jgi:phosphatidylinositol kinase/protein kinase (PI-3  family)
MTDSLLPIPGLKQASKEEVFLAGFSKTVVSLSSKTKPKKITMMATDGRPYVYLLKGHEDLRLDERVQQFITTCNEMLGLDKDTRGRGWRARTYTVIPFGDTYGMIQWVDAASQFFSLYKNSQQRAHIAKLLQKRDSDHDSTPPLRIHEMYFAKVSAALKRHGISRNAPRRKWPLVALKEAFSELQNDTESETLMKEIWSSCITSTSWWSKVNSFCQSMAVNSIYGYILGIGDRHLDNILLDQISGEVIHIDFNVCFEKGRRLRVPENVPFRLTQNMVHAFGVGGIKGHFRNVCEKTLRVLRSNKENLVTLLDAFVYDPLVDWIKDSDDQVEKKVIEINANLNLLQARLGELSISRQMS